MGSWYIGLGFRDFFFVFGVIISIFFDWLVITFYWLEIILIINFGGENVKGFVSILDVLIYLGSLGF